MTTIALFDLDETLIFGDCAAIWAEFSVRKNLVESGCYLQRGKNLHQDYLDGCLDIAEAMSHSLASIKGQMTEDVAPLLTKFAEQNIRQLVYPEAWELLQHHRSLNHHLLLISASGSHIVEPIGKMLDFDNIIGTKAQIVNKCYTGVMEGEPSFREGKVIRFQQWLTQNNIQPEETWFYSDSPNDLPLLEFVDVPVVTNPTPELEKIANARGWPVIHMEKPAGCINA